MDTFKILQFTSVQLLSRVWLFVTPWTAESQASLSITNSWSLLKLMPIESVMPSKHLSEHPVVGSNWYIKVDSAPSSSRIRCPLRAHITHNGQASLRKGTRHSNRRFKVVSSTTYVCMLSCFSHVQLFATLWKVALCPWDFPGKNTRMGCHALLQQIFWTEGLNPSLLYCRLIFFLSTAEPPRKANSTAALAMLTPTQRLF